VGIRGGNTFESLNVGRLAGWKVGGGEGETRWNVGRLKRTEIHRAKDARWGGGPHIRRPNLSSRRTFRDAKDAQERQGKKESACSIRNDGWGGGAALRASFGRRLHSRKGERQDGALKGRRYIEKRHTAQPGMAVPPKLRRKDAGLKPGATREKTESGKVNSALQKQQMAGREASATESKHGSEDPPLQGPEDVEFFFTWAKSSRWDRDRLSVMARAGLRWAASATQE
jgi:hypothetical protein